MSLFLRRIDFQRFAVQAADFLPEVVGGVHLHGGAARKEFQEEVPGDFHAETEHHAPTVGGVGNGLLGGVDGEAFDVFSLRFLEGNENFFRRQFVDGDDAEKVPVVLFEVGDFFPPVFFGQFPQQREAVETEGFQLLFALLDAQKVPAPVALLEGIGGDDAVGVAGFLELTVAEGDEAGFPDGTEEGIEMFRAAVVLAFGEDDVVHAGVGIQDVEDVERFEEGFEIFFGIGFVGGDVITRDAGIVDGDVQAIPDVRDVPLQRPVGMGDVGGAVHEHLFLDRLFQVLQGDSVTHFDFPDDDEVALYRIEVCHDFRD